MDLNLIGALVVHLILASQYIAWENLVHTKATTSVDNLAIGTYNTQLTPEFKDTFHNKPWIRCHRFNVNSLKITSTASSWPSRYALSYSFLIRSFMIHGDGVDALLTKLNSTIFKIIVSKVLDRAAEHEKHEFSVHVLRECRYSFTLLFFFLFVVFDVHDWLFQVTSEEDVCNNAINTLWMQVLISLNF